VVFFESETGVDDGDAGFSPLAAARIDSLSRVEYKYNGRGIFGVVKQRSQLVRREILRFIGDDDVVRFKGT